MGAILSRLWKAFTTPLRELYVRVVGQRITQLEADTHRVAKDLESEFGTLTSILDHVPGLSHVSGFPHAMHETDKYIGQLSDMTQKGLQRADALAERLFILIVVGLAGAAAYAVA